MAPYRLSPGPAVESLQVVEVAIHRLPGAIRVAGRHRLVDAAVRELMRDSRIRRSGRVNVHDLDHLTCMTYVSAITERVRLGVSVINIPWYNPVLLAKRLAAMDVLSNGRITVGVGLAWSEDECDAANIPYRERGRIGEEVIECLFAVWGPDPVEYHGKYFNLQPAYVGPKPVQRPHPRITVGAFAPKALDRAGRLADTSPGVARPSTRSSR